MMITMAWWAINKFYLIWFLKCNVTIFWINAKYFDARNETIEENDSVLESRCELGKPTIVSVCATCAGSSHHGAANLVMTPFVSIVLLPTSDALTNSFKRSKHKDFSTIGL